MKSRKILSLLLSLFLIVTPMLSFISTAEDEATVIKFNEPAIPAIVGEKIDLSNITVEFSADTSAKATFKNGDAAITSFTPEAAGVTVLTATSGDNVKNVYVVAKNKDDKEYVLYYNGFDDDSALDDLTAIGPKNLHSIKDGKLVINATSTDSCRLLLPEWLGDFGNYRIEMVSMVQSATDTARWQSIMYRIQNNNYPYYQMCVRQNTSASSGVEFAVRTPANAWDVQSTGSYKENQKANTYYTHTVEAKDNLIKQSVNGDMCVWTSSEKAYMSGRIGIQVNYSNVLVDSIKVSLQLENPIRPKADSVTLTTAEVKNIMNSVANVAFVDNADSLSKLANAHSAILRVSGDNVVDKDGNTMFALTELYDKIGNNIIPILYVKTNEDADSVVKYISSLKRNFDFSVMSDDPAVVKRARQKNSRIRGIIDLTGKYTSLLTAKDISELRLIVNSSLAKTALLDMSCLDKETVLQLQSLNVNVWVSDKNFSSVTDGVRLLVSGANGVVTNDANVIAAAYEFFDNTAMTRTPFIIGHRGNPTNAPENSIASYVKAWENGADIVETDIYLSADNEIVIMHDGDISRTTDGRGNIESMTVAQLQQYHVWAGSATFQKQYPNEVIPTLRDMFEALKDTDVKIFIEIKSGKAAICSKLVELINEYNFSERVCIITFNAAQITNMQKVAPQITCGYLLSGPGASTSPEEAGEQVYQILSTVQPYNASYNPSFSNQSEEFIDACTERGLAVWPWTYASGSKEAFCNAFRWGYNGLTTNDCQLTAKTVRIINSAVDSLELNNGEESEIEISGRTYDRTVTNVSRKSEMVVLEGEGVVTFEKGVITAAKEGKAVVMFKFTSRLIDGNKYTLYTSPVEINVKTTAAAEESSEDDTSNDASVAVTESNNSEETPSGESSNTALWIIIAIVAVVVIAVAAVVISKKRK